MDLSESKLENREGRYTHLNFKAVCEATKNTPQNKCAWSKFFGIALGVVCVVCMYTHLLCMPCVGGMHAMASQICGVGSLFYLYMRFRCGTPVARFV